MSGSHERVARGDGVHEASGPALAMLDVGDIPRGLLALDVLVKEARVEVLSAGTVQDGRYLLLFGGEVEPVQRSFARALESAGRCVADSMLLADAEERIVPALVDGEVRWPSLGDALGVLQNDTAPTLLSALDAALKGALVDLVQLRVGDGLGGKAIATLWGQTHDVEAALELARETSRRGRGERWSSSIIRNAEPAVRERICAGTRFFGEWRG